MKALQTHAQMLEPSLGFFENEWSVLLQFLLGQGYKLSIRVNGFFVIRSGIERERMFLKLQRHLSKQEGVLAKQWKRMC